MPAVTLSLDNPVFRAFIGYAGLVLVKTSLMSLVTAFQCLAKKFFANKEDSKAGSSSNTGKKLNSTNNSSIERSRRAHLNDLENVIPFVLLGILYTATGPTLSAALLHFRIFTAARFIHTFVYLFIIPQPARAISFFVGLMVNMSMAYSIITEAAF